MNNNVKEKLLGVFVVILFILVCGLTEVWKYTR